MKITKLRKEREFLWLTFAFSILAGVCLSNFETGRYPKWDPYGMKKTILAFVIGFVSIWLLYVWIRWVLVRLMKFKNH